jgi:hypothetical protein
MDLRTSGRTFFARLSIREIRTSCWSLFLVATREPGVKYSSSEFRATAHVHAVEIGLWHILPIRKKLDDELAKKSAVDSRLSQCPRLASHVDHGLSIIEAAELLAGFRYLTNLRQLNWSQRQRRVM